MKHKYNAKRIERDGITFDSKKEMRRYCDLKLMLRAGEIKNLRLQVPFILYPSIYFDTKTKEFTLEKRSRKNGFCAKRGGKYYADFVYEIDGKQIVEDCKGYKTNEYKVKKRQMKKLYNIDILET